MNRILRSRVRQTVIVTLKTGASFRGVLYDADREALVLRGTQVLGGREGAAPVDGELVVLVADVDYLQVV
jgi:hypothetical protein